MASGRIVTHSHEGMFSSLPRLFGVGCLNGSMTGASRPRVMQAFCVALYLMRPVPVLLLDADLFRPLARALVAVDVVGVFIHRQEDKYSKGTPFVPPVGFKCQPDALG